MTLEGAIAAAERTEAVRHLIDQAQTASVELVTVSALELCVLGGPEHPLFEEAAAQAWMGLGNRQRKKLIDSVTEGMIERGLLVGNSPGTGLPQPVGNYSLQPELGVMLAARCRPAVIIVTERAAANTRTPRFFALGDQTDPVRAVVAEVPTDLPADIAGNFPNVRKLGPLGWFYRYVLLPRDTAAQALAELTIAPARQSGDVASTGWVVSAYHPGRQNPSGYRLRIQGDGVIARVDSPGTSDGNPAASEHDIEGLRRVMLNLLTEASR